jgi:hypothetical protein
VCSSSCSHQVLNVFTSSSEFSGSHHVLLNGFVICSSSSQCVFLVMFPSSSQCVHIKFRILWFPPCSSEWVCNLFPQVLNVFSSSCSHQVLNVFTSSSEFCGSHHVLLNGFVTCFLKFSMCFPRHVPIKFSMCSHQVLNFLVPTMFF